MKTRRCHPILAAWLADHLEYVKLFNLMPASCPVCEVPAKSLGTGNSPSYAERDYSSYQASWLRSKDTKCSTTEKGRIEAELTSKGVKLTPNALCSLPHVLPVWLHTLDLLHGVYLGLLKHLMEWIEPFLKKHSRLQLFDTVWKSLQPYPGFTQPRKAYREVSQWQGKEMRNFGRVILPALAAALSTPRHAERRPFATALQCTRALVDFHLMAQYRSHTTTTIGYMEAYLADFHRTKDVFLEFRASKKVIAQSSQAVQQLRDT